MQRSLRPAVRAAKAHGVPLTSIATLAIGLLFLALDVPVLADPLVPLEHAAALQALLLAVGCGALLAKRRAPLAVLAGCTAIATVELALGGSIGMLLVLVDALYSAVLHTSDRGRRALLAIIAGASIGGTLLTLAMTRELRPTALTALQLFALVGTPYWWGLAVQRERERAALESARADDLERLAALSRQEVVQEERGRMARDLHDAIASELSAIAIHAEAALAATAPPRSSLQTIRAASTRSLAQMRSMILVLRSGGDALAAPDRLSDAAGILERARDHGLDVDLTGTLPSVPVATDLAAGRILQESLTNALKHAPGSRVLIRVGADHESLELRIDSTASASASAAAPPAPPSAGLGVRLMSERAAALGGALSAGWGEEGGRTWTVHATLPIR